MSEADTAEYQLARLVGVLTQLREDNIKTATYKPGNKLAADRQIEAQGALRACDEIAKNMGLKVITRTEYDV